MLLLKLICRLSKTRQYHSYFALQKLTTTRLPSLLSLYRYNYYHTLTSNLPKTQHNTTQHKTRQHKTTQDKTKKVRLTMHARALRPRSDEVACARRGDERAMSWQRPDCQNSATNDMPDISAAAHDPSTVAAGAHAPATTVLGTWAAADERQWRCSTVLLRRPPDVSHNTTCMCVTCARVHACACARVHAREEERAAREGSGGKHVGRGPGEGKERGSKHVRSEEARKRVHAHVHAHRKSVQVGMLIKKLWTA